MVVLKAQWRREAEKVKCGQNTALFSGKSTDSGAQRHKSQPVPWWHSRDSKLEDRTAGGPAHPTLTMLHAAGPPAPRVNECLYWLGQTESEFFSLLAVAYILTNTLCDGKPLFTLKILKRIERCSVTFP